jgi:hypothetical protein
VRDAKRDDTGNRARVGREEDRRRIGIGAAPKNGSVLEGENTLPVVLHADDDPTIFLCLVVERLGKGADPRVRRPWAGP